MESVGKFEFNRRDLVGHGAFAVVFKGRHKQRHEFEVAVKCINKRNLAKSQSLLGKEIKILKELKHENIVGLLDFQDISGCVYLVMEYCNGGDLAEYLLLKGSLNEDTIRSFVQQIASAMSILRSKGIIHRDLKPQNILLSHSAGRRASPNTICIKLADFGFARYLQGNTMAATLCGSPMYMAPEVIMSQNYDAKADLWSVGTIVFQCLTGKAPFQANTPQELRLFYERNRKLSPNIPRETSSHLRSLLLGLLQRNHRHRMDFDTFFHHPFLESSSTAIKKSLPMPMLSYPSSRSESSSSGSSTSQLTPTQSEAEMQRPHALYKETPPSPPSSPQLRDSSSSETEEFVMVPAQFPSETGDQSSPDTGMQTGGSPLSFAAFLGRTPSPSPSLSVSPNPTSPAECCGSSYSQSVPVPVPTQIHNYQRIEHNLLGASRTALPTGHCCRGGYSGCSPISDSPRGFGPRRRTMSTGGSRPNPSSPKGGSIPESPDQTEPQSSRTELQDVPVSNQNEVVPLFSDLGAMETPRRRWCQHSPDAIVHRWELNRRNSHPKILSRTRTMPDLQEPCVTPSHLTERRRGSVKRSSSAGRLSDLLLKAVVGSHVERGSCESLNAGRQMDITASGGVRGGEKSSGSPAYGLTPPHEHTPPLTTRRRAMSVGSSAPRGPSWLCGQYPKVLHRPSSHGYLDVLKSSLHVDAVFVPPELPEDTLMEAGYTAMLSQMRFTLAFAHCVMEMAAEKDSGVVRSASPPDASFLEQSQVADQISRLSREWSCAEQLVLYMKCAEVLSTALHTAMEAIKENRLYPSASVKQVVRKLNELYKECVKSCCSLTLRLQFFFSTKQRLMDRINNITAEKIIYSHAVQMVQAAALDEMFHHSGASVQRYQKALLLMEGLSLIITQRSDVLNINKCKRCIERRLSSIQLQQ